MSYRNQQFWRRLVQTIFGSNWFSLPGLFRLRILVYRKVFKLGENPIIESNVWLTRTHGLSGKIKIGKNLLLARDVFIDYSGDITIGDNVWLSEGVVILSHDHKLTTSRIIQTKETIEPFSLEIRNGVWIGSKAIILPKVSYIGENAVIGAGSVVTKDIPDNALALGNPAKVIRRLDIN